jgi:hypothetical protein
MGLKRHAFYQMFQTMADKNTSSIYLWKLRSAPYETLLDFYLFLSFSNLMRPSTPFLLISLAKLER